jgi:hypothetical protein
MPEPEFAGSKRPFACNSLAAWVDAGVTSEVADGAAAGPAKSLVCELSLRRSTVEQPTKATAAITQKARVVVTFRLAPSRVED